MSLHLRYISFLWQVADLGCNLNMPLLRDGARVLMKLMPPGKHAPVFFHIQYTASLYNLKLFFQKTVTVGNSLLYFVYPKIIPQLRICELCVWTMPSSVRTASVPLWTHVSLDRHRHKCSTSLRCVSMSLFLLKPHSCC